jgi:predicted DNA-binding transcriptional regulator AlpA
MPNVNIQPRLIRLKDASAYLGMDKNRFNTEVRPYLTEIPIGTQGIGFDRLDLDQWFDAYKARNGRPGKAMKGGDQCGRKSHRGLSTAGGRGTLPKPSTVAAFEKAVERATSKRQKGI